MKEKTRIGLIGTGEIAHLHAKMYLQDENVEIVAASGLRESNLNCFCDMYGIKNRYLNFREMLKRDDLDAVDVIVHNNLHAPISVEVLNSGKHCYCEKPMAGSYKDAAIMLECAKRNKKMLHIQLAMLYNPDTFCAKQIIDEGKLGKIYHVRSYGYRRRKRPYVDGIASKEFVNSYWSGGGALLDMGVYHISRLLYLLGVPKVERISGEVYQEIAMDSLRQKESGFNVEELGVGFVKFSNRLSMDIIESWAINAEEFPNSMICGSEAGLSIGSFKSLKYISEVSGFPMLSEVELDSEINKRCQIDVDAKKMQNSQVHWIAALRGEVPLLNTAEIALSTMLILEGIYLSSKLGREVTAEEVIENSVSNAIRFQDTPSGKIEYSF